MIDDIDDDEFNENYATDQSNSICPYCYGEMKWCDGCQMWSRVCCEEYGTCQCS